MTEGVNQMQGHLNPALGIEGWYFLLFLHPFNVVFIEILKNADSSKQRKKKKKKKKGGIMHCR